VPVLDPARQAGEDSGEREPERCRAELVPVRCEQRLPQGSPAFPNRARRCRRAFHVPPAPEPTGRGGGTLPGASGVPLRHAPNGKGLTPAFGVTSRAALPAGFWGE